MISKPWRPCRPSPRVERRPEVDHNHCPPGLKDTPAGQGSPKSGGGFGNPHGGMKLPANSRPPRLVEAALRWFARTNPAPMFPLQVSLYRALLVTRLMSPRHCSDQVFDLQRQLKEGEILLGYHCW